MNKQKDFFDKFADFLKDIDLFKSIIPPIHRAGYPFITLFIICTIIFSTLSNFLCFQEIVDVWPSGP